MSRPVALAAILGVLTGWFWPWVAKLLAKRGPFAKPFAKRALTCRHCSEWALAGDHAKITEECFDPMREGHAHEWVTPPHPSFYEVEEF